MTPLPARDVIFAAVARQRREIADLLAGLTAAELATPSLCAGWDVKTVGAHVVSTIVDGTPGFLRLAARRRSMDRAIDEMAQRRSRSPAAELVADLRRHADHPISPPLFGPVDPLADVLVHSGDIRIPLGQPFDPDPRLAGWALDFLTGRWPIAFVPMNRLRGIVLRANDIGRTWRSGAELRGPAAALMMAVTGRTALLHLLDGPGLPMLRARLNLT